MVARKTSWDSVPMVLGGAAHYRWIGRHRDGIGGVICAWHIIDSCSHGPGGFMVPNTSIEDRTASLGVAVVDVAKNPEQVLASP